MGNPDHLLLVAEEDGERLGFIGLHFLPYLILRGSTECYISELFVRESRRGMGIGGRLLERGIEEAKVRGCTRMQLVNFREKESYVRGFYAKHGWEERPTGADFVFDIRD